MDLSLTNITYPLSFSHHHHHRRRRSLNSITFSKSPSLTPIKSSSHNPIYPTPNHHPPNPNPNPLSVLKTTAVTSITVAAIFLSHLTVKPPPAVSIPPPQPPAAVETVNETFNFESETLENEKTLENHLCSHPDDIETLKTLMEIKIRNNKVQEAIGILNQLINLEPEDGEWQLLKHHLHSYGGDHQSAKLGFEEIIKNDPLRVEAYHGLVMAASATESPNELKNVENRILEGIEMCKKGEKKDGIRDFKLLLAQIRVMRGDYSDAIKVYEDLVKEEPRDFRPYLCQGIIYTLLGKNDDAENNFGKYRRLVPKGHPYTKYFDDNMVATKVFTQKLDSERAYSKG